MKVCLDVRKLQDSGIGTYIRGLLGGFTELVVRPSWDFIARPEDRHTPLLVGGDARVHVSRAGNYSLAELFSVSGIANRTGSDLYHAPHYVFPFGLRMPLVVTVHDLIHLKFPTYFSYPKRQYARWMLNRVRKKAAVVLTVSECTKRDLVNELGFDERNITVCYNGVNETFFQRIADSEKERFLQSHGLPGDYLLYAGNFKPHKNVSGLVDAWAALTESVRPPLVLLGDRIGQYEEMVRKVRTLERKAEVFFPTWISEEEMPFAYQCAAACVQPSWYEGFGLPLIEAMASGTPVVSSNRGSLPEVAGDAAFLFDPDDTEAFASALEAALTDQAGREDSVERGLERAREFTWKNAAGITLDCYRSAADIQD